jgi:assimilatory nitrate reductase catalytic subunit
MNLVGGDNGLITVQARPDFPVNKGGMCGKGWNAAELLSHSERLTTPLVRDTKGSPLRPATWDEAIARIVSEVESLQKRFGPNTIGVFGGGGLTNEKSYMLGKFARVALRTAHIDYNGRYCMSSAAAANNAAFGLDRGLPFPLEDIASTSAILLSGSNVAETMPPAMQYFDEMRSRGGSLIVSDPRSTPTARAAALHLQLAPGTDLALANGLLHIAIADGLIDHEYIASRTTGYDSVRQAIAAYWPDRVERITGVPVAKLTRAAHILAEASSAMILTARGSEQQSKGVDTVLSFINLALALGLVGRPHSGYGCLTGQGNGQGGREHGQKADQLPGYRKITDRAHRRHIAEVWGVPETSLPGPGVSAYEMIDSIGTVGGIHALMVMGSNVVVSSPNANNVRAKIESLDFLVVSDMFLSETAAMADVVLPTTQWAEERGTMTNLEGRVILRSAAVSAPSGVKSDLDVLSAIATRLGCGDKFPSVPETVFDELRAASAGGIADYSGITYDRIVAENGVFWPCPGIDHPGTPRLFNETFPTHDGRARFHVVRNRDSAEEPDDDYPIYLTTGRLMAQYQSGTQTRRVTALTASSPEPFVEINPILARRIGVGDGDAVSVASRRGQLTAKARVTASIRQDTIFVPFHWGGASCANKLTSDALDPVSRMPEFKVCAVRVEKAAV